MLLKCHILTFLCCGWGQWHRERGHQGLSGHLSAALSWRGARVGGGFDTLTSWAFGPLTFRPAPEPTCSCCWFGSILPFSCFPACERTWFSWAMAEHGLVLFRSLLSVGSQPCAWDNPNCPSSSPHSSWPSHPAPASGPIPATRYNQPHRHPICLPTLINLLLQWLSLFPWGHSGRRGERWWWPLWVDQGSPPLAYTSQGKKPSSGEGILGRCSACLPWSQSSRCTHASSSERGWVYSFSHGLDGQDWPLVLPHGWLWVNSTKRVSPTPKGKAGDLLTGTTRATTTNMFVRLSRESAQGGHHVPSSTQQLPGVLYLSGARQLISILSFICLNPKVWNFIESWRFG